MPDYSEPRSPGGPVLEKDGKPGQKSQDAASGATISPQKTSKERPGESFGAASAPGYAGVNSVRSPVAAPTNGGGQNGNHGNGNGQAKAGVISRFLKGFGKGRGSDTTLREALQDVMANNSNADENSGIDELTAVHERLLISNILSLRDLTAVDVMIPRADIVAVEIDTPQNELLAMLSQKQNSRFPVYRETLDDVVGTIHIKDILATLAQGQKIVIADLIRTVPIVSPSLPVLDLLVQMRESKKHMALVVDEYGGIDGLATIGDIIEAIVGEFNDEYDREKQPQIVAQNDGSIIADGRVDLEEFEDRFGKVFDDEEREEIDTIGGLVSALAGRVPARGEVLSHDSGMEFEVLDADPRRVNRVKIRNIPQNGTDPQETRH